MTLKRIVVAAEESEASRQGIRTALAWGPALGASVTLFHVLAGSPAGALAAVGGSHDGERVDTGDAPAALDAWLTAELAGQSGRLAPSIETGFGLPSIEIPRFAEREGAGLLVVGRKPRSPAQRLFEGDTADAVARRSTVPCLFVRQPLLLPTRMLVAVDGTERGMRVVHLASRIAGALGSSLTGVTVERVHAGEPAALASSLPAARTAALQRHLDGVVQRMVIRRGEAATEILRVAMDTTAEVIVIGYRRGGPPGVIEGGSVARCVAHHAPCAVLTVPL